MEANTVLLSLEDYNELREDYNELREFKVESGKNLIPTWSVHRGKYYYYTKDEVIKEIAAHNKDFEDEIFKLRHSKPEEKTIEDVKTMSIWQFIRWKRNG